MRFTPALAALLALGAVSGASHAAGAVGGPPLRFTSTEGEAHRSEVTVRVALLPSGLLGIDMDIVYPDPAHTPPVDAVFLGDAQIDDDPSAIAAGGPDGASLPASFYRDEHQQIRLEIKLPPSAPRAHVRFELPAPKKQRFGWSESQATLEWPDRPVKIDRMTSVVLVPAGDELEGYACHTEGDASECTRSTAGRTHPVPILLPAPRDLPGRLALAGVAVAAVAMVRSLLARKAREGAGDPRDLRRRAAQALGSAALAVLAFAALAAGRSPWPMPSTTAAFAALIFGAAVVLLR